MGTDALGESFRTTTDTISVSCHGCRFRSEHYIPKKSLVTIEISGIGLPRRVIPGRVVWVQRPRKLKEEFAISLAFDKPENVWGIAPPPEDWLPFSKDERSAPSLDTATAFEAIPPMSRNPPVSFASSPEITRLQEAIDRAVEKSISRLSESAVKQIVQHVAGSLATEVAEKVYREISDKLEVSFKHDQERSDRKN